MPTVTPQQTLAQRAVAAWNKERAEEALRKAEKERQNEQRRERQRQDVIERLEKMAGCPIGEYRSATFNGLGAIVLQAAPLVRLYSHELGANIFARFGEANYPIRSLADLGQIITVTQENY